MKRILRFLTLCASVILVFLGVAFVLSDIAERFGIDNLTSLKIGFTQTLFFAVVWGFVALGSLFGKGDK